MKLKRLNLFWEIAVVFIAMVGITLSINYVFTLNLFGFAPTMNTYLYYLLACYMSISFLIFPAIKSQKNKLMWFDILLFIITLIVTLYLGLHGQQIILEGWEWNAPALAVVFSLLFWILMLEALRRTGGTALFIICTIISLYPLIAGQMPISFLQGQAYNLLETAQNHALGTDSILGIPLTTVGELILGFLVFGVVLTHSGGGDFFFKIAQSIFGKTRGGEAKVAVVGSAFFGMLSGSAVSNVATTGAMTIPAMKKSGYKSHYAGAIEACSSTGGTITPPIMGTAAFLMASFLNVPYYEIAIAAIIPAVIYFIGLLIQADGYAAKNGLKGLEKSEIPSFWVTLKDGWFYLLALALLVVFIGVLHSEGQAPYYTSAVLLILAMIKKETRIRGKQFFNMLLDIGKMLSEIVCIIAGVGLIVGALSMTGVSFSLSRELVALAGDNLFLLLIAGAITCFVLGMGMTVSASYVFLAIILAPALIDIGIEPIAAHLFVVYCATWSYITPPVALAAYTASGIAKASSLKTGITAVRLGAVMFLVPFYIVYQPALTGTGGVLDIVFSVATVLLGVFMVTSSLEGFLVGAGTLQNKIVRTLLFAGGISMLIPEIATGIFGICITIFVYLFIIKNRRTGFQQGWKEGI